MKELQSLSKEGKVDMFISLNLNMALFKERKTGIVRSALVTFTVTFYSWQPEKSYVLVAASSAAR